jgi:hypothetical protein
MTTHDIIKVRQFSEATLSDFPAEANAYPFVKMGDWAIAEDTGKVYICTSISPVTWVWVGNPDTGGGGSQTYFFLMDI